MSDLISRQAAIDFIKDHSYPVRYDNTSIEQGMTITGIEEALKEVPSIQPKQKTGRWVCLDDDELAYGCSACRSVSLLESKYCPNCGAYMKG